MKRIIKHNENWTVHIKFAQIWRRGAERELLCKWSIGSRARKWFERPSAHHTTAGITQLEFRGVARTIAGRARLCGTHRTHCCWPMGYCWSSVYSVKLDGALSYHSEWADNPIRLRNCCGLESVQSAHLSSAAAAVSSMADWLFCWSTPTHNDRQTNISR